MPPINILLIEDNPGDAFLIQELLKQSDHQPSHPSETSHQCALALENSLEAAFKSLEQVHFDLVLLDLGLPDSQGMDTLLSLQAKSPQLPIVVLTESDDESLAAKVVLQGAQDCLTKGKINPNWLQSTIFHALARSQRVAAQHQQEARLHQSNQILKTRVRAYEEELTYLSDHLKALETRSTTDTLTGIANRYAFEKAFEQAWFQARRSQRSLALVMIDIDYFKQFNDSCGHLWGDQCLQQVAQLLAQILQRPSDLLARYGGEEFVAILPDTLTPGAIDIATKLGEGVKALKIRHPGSVVSDWVTISLGVAAVVPQLKSTRADLLGQADQALYLAKSSGRDRVAHLPSTAFIPQHYQPPIHKR